MSNNQYRKPSIYLDHTASCNIFLAGYSGKSRVELFAV